MRVFVSFKADGKFLDVRQAIDEIAISELVDILERPVRSPLHGVADPSIDCDASAGRKYGGRYRLPKNLPTLQSCIGRRRTLRCGGRWRQRGQKSLAEAMVG